MLVKVEDRARPRVMNGLADPSVPTEALSKAVVVPLFQDLKEGPNLLGSTQYFNDFFVILIEKLSDSLSHIGPQVSHPHLQR